jgi:hypothetical protein
MYSGRNLRHIGKKLTSQHCALKRPYTYRYPQDSLITSDGGKMIRLGGSSLP